MSRSPAQLGRKDWYGPDPEEPSALQRRLTAAASATRLAGRRFVDRARRNPPGFPATTPYPKVFVVGCGRSGTTWVQECLTGSDAIVSTQESHAYEYIYEPLRISGNTHAAWSHILNRYEMGRRLQRWTGLYWWITRDQLLEIASTALSMRNRPPEAVAQDSIRATFDSWYLAQASKGRVLLEKTPGHVMYGAQILDAFPEARIVEVVRDGRDVCVSLEKIAQTMQWPPTRREAQIELWKRAIETGEELHRHPLAPGRVIRVYYEDMLADPRRELTRLFAALDVSTTASEIERISATNNIAIQNPKVNGQRRKGVAGDWRNEFTADDIALFETLAGDVARRIGYDDMGRVREASGPR